MTIRTRQAKLLKLVEVFPLRVSIIAEMLHVHTDTIRSDISYLSSRNKVKIIIGKHMLVEAV